MPPTQLPKPQVSPVILSTVKCSPYINLQHNENSKGRDSVNSVDLDIKQITQLLLYGLCFSLSYFMQSKSEHQSNLNINETAAEWSICSTRMPQNPGSLATDLRLNLPQSTWDLGYGLSTQIVAVLVLVIAIPLQSPCCFSLPCSSTK